MRRPAFIVQAVLFSLSLLSIQGTIYLFQFVAASQMTAPDYSMVRLIESFAAIGALLVSFGIPSVALVKLAALRVAPPDEADRCHKPSRGRQFGACHIRGDIRC